MEEEPQTVEVVVTDAHVPLAIKALMMVVICNNTYFDVYTVLLGRRVKVTCKSRVQSFFRVLLKTNFVKLTSSLHTCILEMSMIT